MVTEAANAARFCKLDDAGNELSANAASWSQVLDRETNLIWCADALGEQKWKKAVADAAAHDIGGFAWRAPHIRELQSIVDHGRFNPAFDPTFFRGPVDWYWSSTPLASSPSGGAWGVDFSFGSADYDAQYNRACVRPVRAASGQ